MNVDSKPIIVHVTEAFGGGVQSAIAHFIEQTPDLKHVIYGRVRAGEQTSVPAEAESIAHTGSFLNFATQLRKIVRDRQPVAVHFHSSLAGVLRPIAGAPRVVYSPHCFAFQRTDISAAHKFMYRAVERAMGMFTDTVVAVSPHEADEAARFVPLSKVTSVSNLGSIEQFEPSRPRGRTVITVGRIAPQKDPEFFATVARSAPATNFIWIGDGDPGLRTHLEDAGVVVTGWQTKMQISEALRNADLYIHTAAWEASPMSLVEALAEGLPVICRDEPSLRSLGYHSVVGPAEALATKVTAFFENAHARQEVIDGAASVVESLRAIPTHDRLVGAYLGTEQVVAV
ncbi:glycosyltransferase [Microbacterium sp. A84]|uniref:glycosyltransferase n=1 Tax=Microbacterium sp. A84 TaxID=3450715 RepID=UPI003F4275D7